MSLPRMSWHIGDYKKDTGHLRAAGHGAYFLLSMHYWSTGGLPDDDKQLAAIACMTDREWKAHRDTLRAFFKGEGIWRHKRIDKELAEAQAKYERRVAAGKKGGNATATLKQSSSNATAEVQQPITDNPKEDKEPSLRSGARKRATRLDQDWRPSEQDFEYAHAKGLPHVRIASEAEKFRNYWTAKSGKDATKVDWPATWRNWILNAIEREGKPNANGRRSVQDAAADLHERVLAFEQPAPDLLRDGAGQGDVRMLPAR